MKKQFWVPPCDQRRAGVVSRRTHHLENWPAFNRAYRRLVEDPTVIDIAVSFFVDVAWEYQDIDGEWSCTGGRSDESVMIKRNGRLLRGRSAKFPLRSLAVHLQNRDMGGHSPRPASLQWTTVRGERHVAWSHYAPYGQLPPLMTFASDGDRETAKLPLPWK